MAKCSHKEVRKHLTSGELRKLIRDEQKRGKSIPSAAKHVGAVRTIAYEWLKRWNESGFDGLISRFAGGKPSKISAEQKKELRTLLEAEEFWYLGDVVDLIRTKFDVEYSERQVR